MMRIHGLVAVALTLLLVANCAVTPNREAIGPYPDDYRDIIKTHVLRTFFDPYSIRSVQISQPVQGHLFLQQGWIVCLEANAKNRMGGYVGIQRTAYLINRGVVVQAWNNAPLCNNPRLQYLPWTELEQVK